MTVDRVLSRSQDWRLVAYYAGRIVAGFGLLMLIPAVVGLVEGDLESFWIFTFSTGLSVSIGYALSLAAGRPRHSLQWMHGVVIAALVWVFATLLGAVPFFLSGYFLSYLDAAFEVMSGLTTTGLTLIQDPDRISDAVNTWRFVISYVGGIGIIVMALTFFVNEAGTFKLYVGEAKDDRLLPNVRSTARAIWRISLLYLVAGSALLFVILIAGGFPIARAPWNAIWMAITALVTCGFAPHSQNLLYYHNPVFEYADLSLALIGSMNFAFHYSLWQGRWREIWRDLEFLAFFTSVSVLWIFMVIGLAHNGTYHGILELVRMGYLNLISAHTGTGVTNLYSPQLPVVWHGLAFFAMIMAMLAGGSATSPAGGFKGIRIGIMARAIGEDVKRLLLPDSAVVRTRYHHFTDLVLTDSRVRGAATIILLYLMTFALGGVVLMMYGYPLGRSLFEAASAVGTVGLSTGITQPHMAPLLKVMLMVMMWVGRLEFVSVFVLVTSVIRRRGAR